LFSFVSIFLFYFRLDPDVTSSTVIVGAQKKKRPRRVVGWHLVCLLLPDIANKAGRRRDDASVTTSSGWVSRNRAQPGEDRRPNTHNTGTNKRKNNSGQKPPHHLFFSSMWIPFCVGFHPLALPQDPSSSNRKTVDFLSIKCVRFSRHTE
jgi:hypothetical protein